MAEQEGKTIHSVAKAIRLLDILTESGQPASLTKLFGELHHFLLLLFCLTRRKQTVRRRLFFHFVLL